MYQRRLFGLLLLPSVSSLLLVLAVAGLLLGASIWATDARSSVFYNYLFGPDGIVTAMQNAPGSSVALGRALLAKPLAYNVIIVFIAAGAGLIVYFVLQTLSRWISGAATAWLSVHESSTKAQKQAVTHEIEARVSIRITILVLWVLYWAAFVKLLLPFCVLMMQTGIEQTPRLTGWGYCLGSFLLLAVGLHVHVVFVRLAYLKPRLFGGRDAVRAAFYR